MRFRKALIYLVSVAVMSGYGINLSAADDDDEDDEEMEEVLVTGSYIRRDNFDLPSPKNILDQADISLSGNAEIGDVIFDQSFQLGVNANATPFEGICCGAELGDGLGTASGWGEGADNQQGNQGTEVWANLRGLGTRATMTMMDGHRLPADTTIRGERAGVDVSGMYPSIAVGRVETILDGASALYGAEAVSGVINMVPRKDFEGLEIAVDYSQPLEDGAPNSGISILGGVQGDRGRAIFAMELREIDRMRFTDRPEYLIDSRNPWMRDDSPGNQWYSRSHWSKFWRDSYNIGSNPASRFRVPVRNTLGELQTPGQRSDGSTPGGSFGGRQASTYRWSDNLGQLAVATVNDPSCAYGFGSGFSDHGPMNVPGGPWAGAQNRWFNYHSRSSFSSPELQGGQLDTGPGGTLEQWEAVHGTVRGQAFRHKEGVTFTYNDITKHGNFLNGTIDPDRPARHCRSIDSDYQDLQAETTRRKGMAYFEYDLNDNLTVRGEIVAGHVDYNTRMYAPGFNDFDTANGAFVSDTMAIAVGSNPGNPFRAFADGSHTNDWLPAGTEAWDPALNNQHDYPGQRTFSTMWLDSVHRQLDFFDLNGNGRYEYLEEPGEALVYAQDLNGDGIPDRDFDGDGIADVNMQRNPAARVLLMDMTPVLGPDGVTMIPARFNPAGGGIALYEDARFPGSVGDSNQSALLFAFPKNPRNTNLDWVHNDGINSWLRRTQRNDIRIRLGGELTLDDWIIDADWIWSKGVRETNQPQEVTAEMVKALRCQAGPQGDSCWNPFGTTYLMMDDHGMPIGDPTITHPLPSDPGWTPSNHAFVNTEEENRLAGVVMGYDIQDLSMNILDVVASNSTLFNLPHNDEPVGFAIGLHYRLEEEEFRPHALNQAATGGPRIALRTSEQETNAIFAEFNLPLLNSPRFGELEVQLAARYTEIESRGIFGQAGIAKFDTTIPKVAIRYQPIDWLALRASLTEGFVTPGLYSLFGDTSIRSFQSVRDYTCDIVPDAPHCLAIGASTGGDSPLTEVANSGNADLDPETSDLYNFGVSISLLDGDLVFDVDYTNVEFRGSIENIDAGTNVSLNENGFYDYVVAQCSNTGPGGGPTLADWDNQNRLANAQADNGLTAEEIEGLRGLDPAAFAASAVYTNAADQACRANAVANWISTDANAGAGESGFGGAALVRGRTNDDGTLAVPLALSYVESPWSAQGSRKTETVIYGTRYSFTLPDSKWLNWMGDDKGQFLLTFSATQFLTQELTKFKSFGCDDASRNSGGFCNNDHIYAGITIDGVGNRNSQYFSPPAMELYSVLPPTPEWRANASLRWFKGNHTTQLAVRWHDRVDNINVAWDAIIARDAQDPRTLIPSWTYNAVGDNTLAYPHFVGTYGENAHDIPQNERCAYQPWPTCDIDSRMYWDATYSYRRTDVFGIGTMTLTASVRNIFDTYPDPITQFSGHEGYLDNIMGRMLLLRVNLGL